MLLTIEGFEGRQIKDGWTFAVLPTVAGRFGGIAASSSAQTYNLPSATDTVICGMASLMPSAATTRAITSFFDGASSNVQCRVVIRGDKFVEIQRGASTVLATSASAISAASGEWVYVEVKCKLGDTTGFVEVRVNGVVMVSYTGDTINTTVAGQNLGVTRIDFETSTNNGYLDDIYVCDTTGPAPFNNYLGEVQVENLVPNGNGAFSQLVGTDGNSVDNYLLVDEVPAVDTDNVSSTTVGQRDTYTFTDPGALIGEVLAVQPNVSASKTVAGNANIKIIERLSDGTERVSAAKPVSNLAMKNDGPKTTDPSGAAWTPATVSAAQFGVEIA